MRIIPAIDIIGGNCVRLTQGNYATQKVYNEDPLEVAKEFEANGFQYLHVVDLDGARTKKIINHEVLRKITTHTKLKVDFGGGLKSNEDLKIAFDCGASQITGGSIAVNHPELFIEWLSLYGSEKIILGADFTNLKISTNGWQNTSEIGVIDFIKEYEQKGVRYVISTDISKDGMLQGASEELYTEILQQTAVKLIASGGVSSIKDLERLKEIGCYGAIVGKAIYEQKISLKELSTLC